VIALPCILYSMDLTVLDLAIPALTRDLKPTASQLLWILDIYGFLVAGSLITMGTLGDRIGRRRLLMIGAAAFGAASVLAAFSRSAGMLIANRALLGVAGATLAPSTLSLIRNMFHDARQRAVAVSVWVTSYSVGAAIGPLLGGVLLDRFWWGSVFLISVPVMVLLLVLSPVLLPEFRDPAARRLDLTSAALSLAAVLAVIYGLKRMAEDGFAFAWPSALSILAGLLAGALFVRRQRREDPLIDLRLFQARAFSASLALYLFACFVSFSIYIFIAQYLQLVLGLTPLQAGLWTLPWSGGFIAGSLMTPLAARRIRPVRLIIGGLVLAAAGFWLMTRIGASGATDSFLLSPLGLVVSGSLVFSLGLSPVFTLANDMILGTAPPERAGAAAGISETGAELGGALGIAIMGSIGAGVYRGRMAGAAAGLLSSESARAARSTLGGAVAAAEQLPGPLGAHLLETARAAFTRALETTAWISVAVVLAMAVLAGALLRKATSGV